MTLSIAAKQAFAIVWFNAGGCELDRNIAFSMQEIPAKLYEMIRGHELAAGDLIRIEEVDAP